MNLSISKSILALLLATGLMAQAGIYNYSGSAYAIPDGTLGGVSSQITVGEELPTLTHIAVTLNFSGGYNGDLYAYLSYGGVLVPLLNRVGVGSSPPTTTPFGYGDSGLNLILTDTGAYGDIHLYQQVGSYGSLIANGTSTWTPDGRNISPNLSTPSQFDDAASSRLALDTTFGGLNPNGTWTLFFADVSKGGGSSTLTSWSMDITAVPEPTNLALGLLGGISLVVVAARRRQQLQGRIKHVRTAFVQWLDAV